MLEELRTIWNGLYALQDSRQVELLRVRALEGSSSEAAEKSAAAIEEEWDDLCYAMALVHEALGIPQEEL